MTRRRIPFRVTQASLNQTAFDFPRNMANIFAAIDEAVKQKSDLLALEELTITGYDAGDDFQKTDNAVILGLLQDIARYAYKRAPNLVISVGHPYRLSDKNVRSITGAHSERRKNALFNRLNQPFNVQSFIGQNKILGMTAKHYLFGYERGYEKRYFAEWNIREANDAGGDYGTIYIRVPGQAGYVPFGRPVIQLTGHKGSANLTHVICEEKWAASRYDNPNGTDDDYELDGVVPTESRRIGYEGLVLVIPNASPPSPLKIDKHIHLAKLASQYADAVIDTDGLGSSGSTFAQFGYRLVVQNEKLIGYGKRLSFARVATDTHAFLISNARSESRPNVYVPHIFSSSSQAAAKLSFRSAKGAWDNPANPDRETEELIRMTSLWLFDYMRKTKSQGITEALSGGADSAFNSVIVAAMVRLAMTELGPNGFCKEMKHLRYKDQILEAATTGGLEAAVETCLQNMLTTIYMGTDNSSDETRNAARLLIEGGKVKGRSVKGIGGKFMTRNVQDVLEFYALVYAAENTSQLPVARKIELQRDLAAYLNLRPETISPEELKAAGDTIKKRYPELKGDILSAADPRHSIAYENIQARARQVAIMMFTNAEGKMGIANPNLDEGRNAYATFGGDLHSGTINLNGFINKAKQLQIMQHLYKKGLQDFPPVASLALILKNKPSAELQPKNEAGQVIQNDEDALQRDFHQMNYISQAMLAHRAGIHQERRLNPAELFDACKKEILFTGVDDVRLYNMVRFSYARWVIAQHKIHASPITPTFGDNVDHQTSLRTPNLSGQDRAALTQLGVRQLFAAAKEEFGGNNPAWQPERETLWQKRALLDEDFVDAFENELKRGKKPNMEFDLGSLYQRTRKKGLGNIFGPVSRIYYTLTPI